MIHYRPVFVQWQVPDASGAGAVDFFGEWYIICFEAEDMLVLASASPRRQSLFRLLGLPFTVAVSDVDEPLPPGALPQETVRTLAMAKAQSVASRYRRGLVIAADTVVALDHRLLGKPRDADEAVAMLIALRDRWHRVYTGLVALDVPGSEDGRHSPAPAALHAVVTSDVLMRDYSDAEIAAYVATGDPLDKAAAYAIQHTDFDPVLALRGCYANVMGLPLCHLYAMLAESGLGLPVHPSAVCPTYLAIACSEFGHGTCRSIRPLSGGD
jgi:septum formation protein